MKHSGVRFFLGIAATAAMASAAFAQSTPPTAGAAAASQPAAAAPTAITAGSPIRDSAGVQIGTLVSSDANKVIIDTGDAKVGVPMSFVTSDAQGAKLKITAAQFNAARAKAHARTEAAQQATSATPPAQPQSH